VPIACFAVLLNVFAEKSVCEGLESPNREMLKIWQMVCVNGGGLGCFSSGNHLFTSEENYEKAVNNRDFSGLYVRKSGFWPSADRS
jgi:hypothetical protein